MPTNGPPDISERYPLAWVDPELVCDLCHERPAEYSNIWGSHVWCGPCSAHMETRRFGAEK